MRVPRDAFLIPICSLGSVAWGIRDAQLPLLPAVPVHIAILKINLAKPGLQGEPMGGRYGQRSK